MTACPDIYELLHNKGRNVLYAAAESRMWAAIFFFLIFFYGRPEFEGLINEQDEEGNTPSNIATINGHTYMAQRLEKGRDIICRENIRSGAGVKPVFYASQSDHTTSGKKKLPAIVPLQTAKTSHARKQKNPKSSHTIPLLPSRHSLIAGA